MEKKRVTMTNWLLSGKPANYNLSGYADSHPQLGRNVYISYTSSLVSAEINEDVLIYETRNTIYVCPLKYIRIDNPYKHYEERYLKQVLNFDDDCFGSVPCINKIMKALIKLQFGEDTELGAYLLEITEKGKQELAEMKEKETKRLIDIVKDYDNSLYFEISCIANGDNIAYNIDGKIGIIEPYLHVGTFQDSVLYQCDCVDFRYFPKGCSLDTYHWSDTIKYVYVKNMKEYDIEFNGKIVKPNEIICFEESSGQEGLISPDCVNGKSLLKL